MIYHHKQKSRDNPSSLLVALLATASKPEKWQHKLRVTISDFTVEKAFGKNPPPTSNFYLQLEFFRHFGGCIYLDISEIKKKNVKDSLCIPVFCSALYKGLHDTAFCTAHIL